MKKIDFDIQLNYQKPLMTFSDIVNGRYNSVHNALYESALAAYCKDNDISTNDYRFIEVAGQNYNDPSHVLIIEKAYPYKKITVSLKDYWNTTNIIPRTKLSYLMLDDDLTVETSEVIYKDYGRGTATLQSRYNGNKFDIKLEDLSYDHPENQESMKYQSFVEARIEGEEIAVGGV